MMPVYARGLGEPNRNFWLGVYNGVLVNGAEAFFHSSLVLAPFLAQLGAPAAVIGLVPALRVGGWLLPQLFVASRLAHQPFKLPWYRRVSLLRFAAFAGMTLSVFVLRGQPQWIVPVVLAMLALNAVGRRGLGRVVRRRDRQGGAALPARHLLGLEKTRSADSWRFFRGWCCGGCWRAT